ncbi:hypothetical protein [Winogradskyella endarachnes]|uniref:Uncharacterized protein n=1 Tax=Winogradskyella endarachnes TaxID=2681965 RepID=A0A6L6U4P8_9FLAO|nr:hypothetical protein [Winogradskyella endarachnes]MUU76819.1 hypothetical protein [Winogradskyella endarachnes]
MNNSTEILFSIGQSMYGFTMLIILTATIILFIKKRTPATWMILIGYLLVCISYLTSLIIITIAGRSSMDTMLQIQGISSIVKSLSYLIFAIGLIMLAITEFSKKEFRP